MKFVAFVGPKGSGKDTSADILLKNNRARQKMSFAGPLKEICAKSFELPTQLMHDPVLKEKDFKEPLKATARILKNIKRELPKYLAEMGEDGLIKYNIDRVAINGLENRLFKNPREILQIIGTDFIRNRVYQSWHLEAAFGKTNLAKYRQDATYCITDTRFLNEYEYLKELFGDAIDFYYVERPKAEKVLKKATHESELEILKIKEKIPKENIIKNNKKLEDLEKIVMDLRLPKASVTAGTLGENSASNSRFVYGTRS